MQMIDREALGNVDPGNPSEVKEGVMHIGVFPLGELKYEGGNILWFFPIRPWRMLELGQAAIPNDNGCGRIEEIHIGVVTRVT